MDISSEYIKMCEKAEEIQKKWKPEIGDYFFRKYTVFGEELDSKIWKDKSQREEMQILHYKSIGDYYHSATIKGKQRIVNFKDTNSMVKATSIFLPRQDQLQEIGEKIYYDKVERKELSSGDNCHIVFHFNKWLNAKRGYSKLARSLYDWPSMEQLWLAFVMKEKYKKVWDGKEWVIN